MNNITATALQKSVASNLPALSWDEMKLLAETAEGPFGYMALCINTDVIPIAVPDPKDVLSLVCARCMREDCNSVGCIPTGDLAAVAA
jgi:hypothetical protein